MLASLLRSPVRAAAASYIAGSDKRLKTLKVRKNIYILKSPTPQRHQGGIGPVIFLIFSTFLLCILFFAPKLQLMAKRMLKKAQFETSVALIEKDSLAFEIQTSLIRRAPECFPIEINRSGYVSTQYQFCSPEAQRREQLPVTITDHFTVSPTLARRFNFWRRIYSTWGSHQYVLHLSEWPEVVLAVFDVSQAPDKFDSYVKENMIKKISGNHKKIYVHLLQKMHKQRNRPESFSYAMDRIAQAMSHIKDPDKYLKAAQRIRLQKGQRDYIERGLHTAPKYLPGIELEFEALNIPVELSRIAFIESSFNTRAYSKVGASGAYQIMPETGRQFGLKIGGGIDERNDPIKAGRVAAMILKENFRVTRSWPLAITAYNHGAGGIQRAVRSTGSEDLSTLITTYKRPAFGFASKNFYASFLGMLATLKDKDRYFPSLPKVAPLTYRSIRLAQPTYASTLKNQFSVTSSQFRELNLDLSSHMHRDRVPVPRGSIVKVPDTQFQGYGLLTLDSQNQ